MTEARYPEWVEKQLNALSDGVVRSNHAPSSLRAVSAKYDGRKKMIQVELHNGASFSFPPRLAQGLEKASPSQLAQIELSPMGVGLSWPLLDVDLRVEGLLHGVFGSRAWMREHAAKAGRVRSEAKASAARANGARGGRPRKLSPVSA